jgi:hypothetical protein
MMLFLLVFNVVALVQAYTPINLTKTVLTLIAKYFKKLTPQILKRCGFFSSHFVPAVECARLKRYISQLNLAA